MIDTRSLCGHIGGHSEELSKTESIDFEPAVGLVQEIFWTQIAVGESQVVRFGERQCVICYPIEHHWDQPPDSLNLLLVVVLEVVQDVSQR